MDTACENNKKVIISHVVHVILLADISKYLACNNCKELQLQSVCDSLKDKIS